MLALAPHRPLESHAEPFEILEDRRLEFRAAARRVDILDAQEKPSAAGSRRIRVDERRERVAKMQIAVRARGEAKHRGRGRLPSHAPLAAPSPSRRRHARSSAISAKRPSRMSSRARDPGAADRDDALELQPIAEVVEAHASGRDEGEAKMREGRGDRLERFRPAGRAGREELRDAHAMAPPPPTRRSAS